MFKVKNVLMASCIGACAAAGVSAGTVADNINVQGSSPVLFLSAGNKIAGNLYLPPSYKEGSRYPAVVVSHPWGGVKEQTAGLYAQQLAKKGFITLAYDASHYGKSEGTPRDFENPAERVNDIRSAVSYLSGRKDVSAVGTLGICAGGGYTLHEAQDDPRVKAVATVVAYDIGDAARNGIAGAQVTAEMRQTTMNAVAKEWTEEESGKKPVVLPLLPDKKDWTDKTDAFTKEAYSYYRESRGAHPNATNKFHLSSIGLHMAYYPLDHMEKISPRPVLLIAGEKAQTLKFSQQAYERAQKPKELVVVPGATHFAMYDKPELVGPNIEKLGTFFAKYLSK